MLRRVLIAVAVLFVAWSGMDFLLHGKLLLSSYAG